MGNGKEVVGNYLSILTSSTLRPVALVIWYAGKPNRKKILCSFNIGKYSTFIKHLVEVAEYYIHVSQLIVEKCLVMDIKYVSKGNYIF